MQLLFVITDLDIGGAETQVVQLAKQFSLNKHQVHVVSMIPPRAFVEELEAGSVEVSSLRMHRGIPDPRGIYKLAKLIREWRPQIVHSHMVHANLLTRLTRLVSPMPVLICTAHSTIEGDRWREIAYRLTDWLCDLTTHVSRAGAERAIRIGSVPKNKIHVIPNGVDTKRFRSNPAARDRLRRGLGLQGQFAWLAVGRFETVKDYPTMIEAFACARKRKNDIVLLLVGQGALEDTCRKLAVDLGLENSIRFLGLRDDVAELMNAADAFVMSSLWEGLSMALLEAAASGLPIVATDVGGNNEIVSQDLGGYLTPVADHEALCAAMLELMLVQPETRQALQGRVQALIKTNYDIEEITRKWGNLYSNMAQSKGFDLEKQQ